MVTPSYPPARRLEPTEQIHGHEVADPYRWLEDPDTAESLAWTAGQDELFESYREGLTDRERWADKVSAMFDAGSVSCPIWRGERHFFSRRDGGRQHPVFAVAGLNPGDDERILIDPMELDRSGATSLVAVEVDREGRQVAYQLTRGGDEEATLWVLDTETGRVVDGPIDRCRYSPVAWLAGGQGFYYVRRPPPGAPGQQHHRRVYLHWVATPTDDDVEVFGAGREETTQYTVSVSDDGRWLTITARVGTQPRNDLWIADLTAGPPASPAFVAIQDGVDARIDIQVGSDGNLYLYTDRNAPRGRLVAADPDRPGVEHWRDLIPEDPDATLSDIVILDDPLLDKPLLLACRERHAISEVVVHDLASGAVLGTVPLPGLGAIRGMSARTGHGHEVWLRYVDHVTPASILRYDARTGLTAPWARAHGIWPDVPIVSTNTSYLSADGTRVRMVILTPPGPRRPRPTILYGYGGFGVSLAPSFSASILAWVQAGGVYAVANLRGGGEEGQQWHQGGSGRNKHKVFEDFHAAAETLIAAGWTIPEQLAASGASNGGLIVAGALVQRPDLYAAVHCDSPLLDMVRYEMFGLGPMWTSEYGSASSAEELDWLLSYSPYHQVRAGVDYPATLFTVSDADSRVDPLHARKMTAALQSATSGTRPILLRREAEVGHGARALGRTVSLIADALAFCARNTGLAV
jgi:prolyl oligopeptidase